MDRNLTDLTKDEVLGILMLRNEHIDDIHKEFPSLHRLEIKTIYDEYWMDHTDRWGSALSYVNSRYNDADIFSTVYWLKAQLSKSDTLRYLRDDSVSGLPEQMPLFVRG